MIITLILYLSSVSKYHVPIIYTLTIFVRFLNSIIYFLLYVYDSYTYN